MARLGRLESIYMNRMRDYLVAKAQDIIEKAQRSKTTGDITGTQLDSYGAVIFYNGKVRYTLIPTHSDLSNQAFGLSAYQYEDEERHKGWAKAGIPDGTGVEWAKMFVNEIKKSNQIPKTGFALVVFNAAFYSNVQEGTGKWKILSQVVGDIKNIQSQFKGSEIKPIGNITIG